MRFVALSEKVTGAVVQFRQAVEQLLQGVAHLAAFLIQLPALTAGAMLVAPLRQLCPVLLDGCAAMGEQQRRFETRQVEQQLVTDPASGARGILHTAVVHRHFKALGIAVAANRQLRTGQA